MKLWDYNEPTQVDFASEVLHLAKKRRIKFYGCAPLRVELTFDGSVKLWFAGTRKNKPWMGGIKVRGLDIQTAIEFCKPEILVNAIESQIDEARARFDV